MPLLPFYVTLSLTMGTFCHMGPFVICYLPYKTGGHRTLGTGEHMTSEHWNDSVLAMQKTWMES